MSKWRLPNFTHKKQKFVKAGFPYRRVKVCRPLLRPCLCPRVCLPVCRMGTNAPAVDLATGPDFSRGSHESMTEPHKHSEGSTVINHIVMHQPWYAFIICSECLVQNYASTPSLFLKRWFLCLRWYEGT